MTKIKEHPERLAEVKKIMDAMGISMKALYFTFGRYDLVIIVEAPDDDAALKCLLAVSSRGGVTFETLKAISGEKAGELIKQLP